MTRVPFPQYGSLFPHGAVRFGFALPGPLKRFVSPGYLLAYPAGHAGTPHPLHEGRVVPATWAAAGYGAWRITMRPSRPITTGCSTTTRWRAAWRSATPR